MMRPWTPIPEGIALRDRLAGIFPVLTTERLTLRAPRSEDWATLEPIWRTDRGRFIGGPFNEEDAWLDFAQAAGGWVLRGIGFWTVTRNSDGGVLGIVGMGQEVFDPELELGWMLTTEAEGQGYAYEAAAAVLKYAFNDLGLETLISFIHCDNHRSIALAERLGAAPNQRKLPIDLAPEDLVFRHLPRKEYRRDTDKGKHP